MNEMKPQDDREVRVSMKFVNIVKNMYVIPMRTMYNMRTANAQKSFDLEPPYLVLANHVNTYDPILISLMNKKYIHWVAADTLFRNRVLRYAMRRLIGSISKSKSRSDYYTIKQITESIKKGWIVGMFPEGQRTWDGRSLPLFYATAKLVRLLKVPVVICTLKGGYHTLPRWANKRRRGKLTIEYQDPIMPEEFAKMKVSEIDAMLTEKISYDAYEFQRENRILFKSDARAEYVEHVLYICPECGKMATLRSMGNEVSCTSCDYTATMDSYGFFEYEAGVTGHETVADWNAWQHQKLEERISAHFWKAEERIFPGDNVKVFEGYREKRMKVNGPAEVNMTIKGLQMIQKGKVTFFPFLEIESMAVAMQRNLEFYHNNTMYRFKFPAPRSSAYKYLAVYEAISNSTL